MKISDKDIVHALLMLAIALLGIMYFSVPERAAFLEYQLKWWGEWLDIIRKL